MAKQITEAMESLTHWRQVKRPMTLYIFAYNLMDKPDAGGTLNYYPYNVNLQPFHQEISGLKVVW